MLSNLPKTVVTLNPLTVAEVTKTFEAATEYCHQLAKAVRPVVEGMKQAIRLFDFTLPFYRPPVPPAAMTIRAKRRARGRTQAARRRTRRNRMALYNAVMGRK